MLLSPQNLKSSIAVPLIHKSGNKLLHIGLACLCDLDSCLSIHQIRQLKQLLIKVIDRSGFAFEVFFLRHVQVGLDVGMIHMSVVIAAIGKCTGNSDGTDGIEAIGILHTSSFQGGGDRAISAK